LDILGLAYEVHPSAIDEKAIRDPAPAALTKKLAEAKAWKVASALQDAVVVAGDAVVAKGQRIFEKPRSHDEAAEFLRELSGTVFQFVTSLIVIRSDTKRMLSTVETSEIKFRQLVADSVSGSYNFITALPVSRLAVFLREQGVEV
jgi:septum formation protein